MKNIFFILSSVVCFLFFVSCSQSEGKTAEDFLQSAQQLQQFGNYTEAKWQIDSIHILFPKNVPMRKEANLLLNKIELAEYKQSFDFLQTELQKQQNLADALSKKFVLQKDEKYQSEGVFVHKSQVLSHGNLTRTILKAFVMENGQLNFDCTVFGQSLCVFNAVRISVGDVFAETRPVTEDGVFNRSFSDDLYDWQTVTFRGENDAATLIAQSTDKNIKISTLNKCKTSFNMEKEDKLAFKDAYAFSLALSEITRLKTETAKAGRMIEHLQKRLAK